MKDVPVPFAYVQFNAFLLLFFDIVSLSFSLSLRFQFLSSGVCLCRSPLSMRFNAFLSLTVCLKIGYASYFDTWKHCGPQVTPVAIACFNTPYENEKVPLVMFFTILLSVVVVAGFTVNSKRRMHGKQSAGSGKWVAGSRKREAGSTSTAMAFFRRCGSLQTNSRILLARTQTSESPLLCTLLTTRVYMSDADASSMIDYKEFSKAAGEVRQPAPTLPACGYHCTIM